MAVAKAVIRVVLADDQALLRGTIRLLIDGTPGMKVVGEADNGADAVSLAREHRADVVLMDVQMPEMDGIEATRLLASDHRTADVKVLILTTFEVDEYVAEAIRAGASGFLGKDADPAELVRAVETVAAGEVLLSASATRVLMERFQQISEPRWRERPELLSPLTPREREILALVAGGLTNDGISRRLSLSPHTVKTHINRAMAKLGVSERAQLVVIAYESGLVRPGGRNNLVPHL
ncbi:response regulator transcription factor [Actinospica sp.]|uniref:response regulator transcription factor n=1 Tax=Actinospica sp. TaxID=1872142 RepID=UPI002D072F11|nr:response regulator transcription factor [Actinospica sp.]HWG26467.1 response regulator transcription factor [Actinospica sp.]